MKIENIGETVEGTITALQTEGFKIANTAHMMEILSKRLYSNPELAVCRELVCNAIDSHVAAGTKQPVEVFLPDWTNDFRFVVKDYGTGLSEEDVLNLYTTYGASTKQSSNDFIGCLGIGSKSPFAVTEEFSVVSRYNGKSYSYHCYKQNGMPVCTKLSENPTDEHNGMTITVPFKNNGVSHFISSSEKFFKGVSKELVKVHSPNPLQFFEDCDYSVSFKGSVGSVFLQKERYSDDFVRMGQVLYHIPMQWLRDSAVSSCYGVVLEVPIGTFTIAASRENIEENDTNKHKFLQVMEVLKKEYADKYLLPVLKTAKTYHTYVKLKNSCDLFDFNDLLQKAYEASKFDINNSVGYVKAWDKRRNRWKATQAVYSSRHSCVIVPDEEPVVAIGTLLKRWHNTNEEASYVLVNEARKTQHTPAKYISLCSFDKVVFMSQLNRWYEYLSKQLKRRRKTSKKVVKSDVFTIYEFGRDFTVRNKKTSEQVQDLNTVPYVVLKELEPIEESDKFLIEDAYRYDVACYGVSLVNSKNLPDNYQPLKDYIEEHKQVFEDRDYASHRKECIRYLKLSQSERKYTSQSVKDFLGKDMWLSEFRPGFTKYEPRTLGDRLAFSLQNKYKNYQKFLTSVSGWFNIYGYKEAPEEVKAYVRKLFKDMVESCESSAE